MNTSRVMMELMQEQQAEIERLRAELEALRKQEPVAWMNVRNGFICKKPTNADYQQPLYLAAGAQPATPSTQITPNWIWSWLMDWCKRRGVPPSNYDSLFQMASDALYLAAGAQPATPDKLAALGAELKTFQWIGEDVGWNLAIEAVRTRISAMLAPTEPDANCLTTPDGGCVGGTLAGKPPCMHDAGLRWGDFEYDGTYREEAKK